MSEMTHFFPLENRTKQNFKEKGLSNKKRNTTFPAEVLLGPVYSGELCTMETCVFFCRSPRPSPSRRAGKGGYVGGGSLSVAESLAEGRHTSVEVWRPSAAVVKPPVGPASHHCTLTVFAPWLFHIQTSALRAQLLVFWARYGGADEGMLLFKVGALVPWPPLVNRNPEVTNCDQPPGYKPCTANPKASTTAQMKSWI